MRPLDAAKIGLAGVWGLVLVIFVIQNWGTDVSLVIAGSAGQGSVPLPIAVLGAYLLGGGVGAVLVGSWRLHDYWRLRQAEQLLMQIEDRMYALEQQQYRQDVYLPPEMAQGSPPDEPEDFPPSDDAYHAAPLVEEAEPPTSNFDWRDLGEPRRDDPPRSDFDWRELGEPRRWDY